MRSINFIILVVLCLNFSILTTGNSKPLILVDNKYDFKWFDNLTKAWNAKYLSEVNNVNPVDILLISLALGNIELYLTKLPNLIININNAFHNNEEFKKFNSTDSLAYNFFKFLSYINSSKKNEKELNSFLSQAFNIYEIVSIKRLTEVDLAQRFDYAKKIILKENLNNKRIEEISAEYNILYVQEIFYEKKKQNKSSYLSCINKLNTESIGVEAKILECNKLYSENNKDNYILGIRACYLLQLEKLKNSNISTNIDINKLTNELHNNCAKCVDSYIQKFPESKIFIQKHINFLINFFISYKIFNI